MAQKLLDRVRETCRLKHMSIRIEDEYVRWIRDFFVSRYVLKASDTDSEIGLKRV